MGRFSFPEFTQAQIDVLVGAGSLRTSEAFRNTTTNKLQMFDGEAVQTIGGGGYDLMDGLDGSVTNGTLFLGKSVSDYTWGYGAATVEVAPAADLVIAIYVNGTEKAKITIGAGLYASVQDGFPVDVSRGDVVKVLVTGANGAQNLAYGIGQ